MKRNKTFDKGIVTLSFDDARKDTYRVFKEVLEIKKIPCTLNVPAGYVEIGFNDFRDVGYNGLMSKEELDEMANSFLVEISSHGYMHTDSDQDTIAGVNKLCDWYPYLSGKIGYAVPHSSISKDIIEKREQWYKELGIQYVRGGRDFEKNRVFKRAISLLARKMNSSVIYTNLYKHSMNYKRSFYLNAVPLNRETTLKQVKALLDYCASNKTWLIIEIHGVDYKNSDEYQEIYCFDRMYFEGLCDYIKCLLEDNKIEIRKTIDVIRGL